MPVKTTAERLETLERNSVTQHQYSSDMKLVDRLIQRKAVNYSILSTVISVILAVSIINLV